MTTVELKLMIEEKIKVHERAKECLRYPDMEKVEIRIAVYKQILGMIDGPTNNNFKKEGV